MRYPRNDPTLKERRRELRRDQTDAERAFWQCVRGKQFQGLKFFRQYSVGPYILDFYCPEKRLAVELDGGQHTEEMNKERDNARTGYLQSQGIRVVRFWDHEMLKQREAVLEKLFQEVNRPAS